MRQSRWDWLNTVPHELKSFSPGIPEGRPRMLDVSPVSGILGLSLDSTLLSPVLFFCLVLLPFLSYLFLPAGPFSLTFSRKFFNIFRREIGFLYDSCLAAMRSKLVGGMCSVLPYATNICCYAFIYYFKIFIASVHSFSILF